jgi:hypothetical protein
METDLDSTFYQSEHESHFSRIALLQFSANATPMNYESRSQMGIGELAESSALTDAEKKKNVLKWVESLENKAMALNFILITLGAGISYLIMAGLFSIGFFEISKAILVFYEFSAASDIAMSKESAVLEMSLKGLEFLFMAPLSFLVLGNLKRYVSKSQKHADQSLARHELANAKIPIVSLMIAIVSTDLIAKILRKDGLTYQAVITEGVVIIIMIAYLFLLEWLVSRSSHETKKGS